MARTLCAACYLNKSSLIHTKSCVKRFKTAEYVEVMDTKYGPGAESADPNYDLE
jgi:hypothetical protein